MLMFMGVLTLFTFSTFKSQAQNMGTRGPHGGYMQTPANFHTEVILGKDRSFTIYLLDLEFSRPMIKNSKVVAWITANKIRSDFLCKPEIDHFYCQGKKTLTTGTLFVRTIRGGVAAAIDASYDLPLTRSLKDFKTLNH